MDDSSKPIGIVGGLGPAAGIDLTDKVFQNTRAGSDQEHLDVIMVSMPARVVDRSEFLLGQTSTNPAQGIVDAIGRLEMAGAVVAGIPCNTAHAAPIFDEVIRLLDEAGSTLKVVHMIEAVARHISECFSGVNRVGVLATNGTVHSNVYAPYLKAFGIKVVYPEKDVQSGDVHPAIYDPVFGLKANPDSVSSQAVEKLENTLHHLAGKGAEVIVLACTEIPLAIRDREYDGVPLIDPAVVLARNLIRQVAPDKLKQD